MLIEVVMPHSLKIGGDVSGQVNVVLNELNLSKPLIVTDRTMVQLGYVQRLESQLSKFKPEIFDETIPEPTAASIRVGVDMIGKGDYDCIIAIGGGSVIDSAKAMSVLGVHGGCVSDYKFPRNVYDAGLPIVAIPTTGGTGSEVSNVTVITDESSGEKMLCMGAGFMPTVALVDYKLTMSVPPRTTADAGIDALTHALESFVSRKGNIYSDSQAIAALKLLAPNLRTVYFDGKNEAARRDVMSGSTLAGIAFSNASVAMVHGLARPIGAFFHVPHGMSNAMLLPIVTSYSIDAAEKRYAEASRAMGFATAGDTDKQANVLLIEELELLCHDLGVPTLGEFGVTKDEFDRVKFTMAEQALASGSPGNNPRVPDMSDIVSIYEQLW